MKRILILLVLISCFSGIVEAKIPASVIGQGTNLIGSLNPGESMTLFTVPTIDYHFVMIACNVVSPIWNFAIVLPDGSQYNQLNYVSVIVPVSQAGAVLFKNIDVNTTINFNPNSYCVIEVIE